MEKLRGIEIDYTREGYVRIDALYSMFGYTDVIILSNDWVNLVIDEDGDIIEVLIMNKSLKSIGIKSVEKIIIKEKRVNILVNEKEAKSLKQVIEDSSRALSLRLGKNNGDILVESGIYEIGIN